MKRILILNYEFPPLGGGAATATFNLLKQFSEVEDLQVDLITSSAGKYKEEQFAGNIKIYYLDIGKSDDFHNQSNKELFTYSWKAWKLGRKLKKNNQYDLIHAFFGIPCGFIALFLGGPFIVSLRGSDVPFYSEKYALLDKLFFRFISPWIWKKSRGVVANSEGLKKLAQKSSPDQEIGVIYNGVDIDKFRPADKSGDKLIIVSTSRLTRRKGINHLVEGFASFANRYNEIDHELIMAGGGEQLEELKKLARKLNVLERTQFLGQITRDEVVLLYKKADAFALPSFNEGMSNSLLEAMASGLAILATDTGGTKELISENGIIIEKGNSDSIFSALENLHQNRQMLSEMKLASRRKAENMSWKNMADRYLEIYSNKV